MAVALRFILSAVAVGLAGCMTAPATALPDGISVAVLQTRLDRGDRQLEIRVTNETPDVLTVTAAEFRSSQLAAPAVWVRGPSDIRPGVAVDLRVDLTAARCDFEGQPTSHVTLSFSLENGPAGTVTVVPDDPIAQVPGLTAEDCLAETAAEHALITLSDALVWQPGTRTPAELELSIRPTGHPGEVTIGPYGDTVLLDVIGAPENVEPIAIGPDSGPSVIRLAIVPNRCDPHAVAEDKRGTFFPLELRFEDGVVHTLYLPVVDSVRSSLYAFVTDFCKS